MALTNTERAIRGEFPGEGNKRLRRSIRAAVEAGIPVMNLAGRIALTACGEASLREVEQAQIAEDDRLDYLREGYECPVGPERGDED